jgi:myosin heavy subunit
VAKAREEAAGEEARELKRQLEYLRVQAAEERQGRKLAEAEAEKQKEEAERHKEEAEKHKEEAGRLKTENDAARRKAEEAELALKEATQKREQLQEDAEAMKKKAEAEATKLQKQLEEVQQSAKQATDEQRREAEEEATKLKKQLEEVQQSAKDAEVKAAAELRKAREEEGAAAQMQEMMAMQEMMEKVEAAGHLSAVAVPPMNGGLSFKVFISHQQQESVAEVEVLKKVLCKQGVEVTTTNDIIASGRSTDEHEKELQEAGLFVIMGTKTYGSAATTNEELRLFLVNAGLHPKPEGLEDSLLDEGAETANCLLLFDDEELDAIEIEAPSKPRKKLGMIHRKKLKRAIDELRKKVEGAAGMLHNKEMQFIVHSQKPFFLINMNPGNFLEFEEPQVEEYTNVLLSLNTTSWERWEVGTPMNELLLGKLLEKLHEAW